MSEETLLLEYDIQNDVTYHEIEWLDNLIACSTRFSIEIEGANALEFSDDDADDEEQPAK